MTIQIKAIYNAKYLNIMSEILKYIQVVVIKLPDGSTQRQFGQPLTSEEKRILSDLGFSESIYL